MSSLADDRAVKRIKTDGSVPQSRLGRGKDAEDEKVLLTINRLSGDILMVPCLQTKQVVVRLSFLSIHVQR